MSVGCLRLHALRERAEMAGRLPDQPDFGRKDLWGYTPLVMATRACLATIGTDLGGCEVFNVVAADIYHPEPSRQLRNQYYPQVPLRGDFSGQCRSTASQGGEGTAVIVSRTGPGPGSGPVRR